MAFQSDVDDIQGAKVTNFHVVPHTLTSNVMHISAEIPRQNISFAQGKTAYAPDRIAILRGQLEEYRCMVSVDGFSEEEIESVDLIVTAKMNEENNLIDQKASATTYLERGFAMLLPMFESDELTPRQKSALFIMLEHQLDGNSHQIAL